LGFSGVTGALKDYTAANNAAGQSSASLAQTAFSNALAIRNAEQAITDAKKQAAQAQIQSAQQITSAQQGVTDAERQAATATQASADAIVAAQQRVESATYSLAQSQQSETNALYTQQQALQTLTQAQSDAANTIADLQNAATSSHLAVETAARSEASAQNALNLAKISPQATPDQIAAADLALRIAKEALVEAKQHEIEATEKATEANKQGVNGLPSVVNAQHAVEQSALGVASAQHGVTAALQGQSDAQHALVVAQQHAADQQIASAESVAKAQASLATAVKGAADQQVASQQSVQRAVQALADTQKQQSLAAAAAAASASTAASKFQQDMVKASQPTKDFVNQLLSMKGGFDQLKLTAQSTMLPGFTQLLKDAGPLLPGFNTEVGNMGTVLGGLARQAGALLQDPAFRGALIGLLQQGVTLTDQLGTGFVNMFHGLVIAAGPALPIVNALGLGFEHLMTTGIPAFFAGLSVNAQGTATGLGAVVRMIDDLLGPIGILAGAFSGALGPALGNLEPDFRLLADDILNALLPVMPDLSKALLAVVDVVDQLLPILTPLIPLIANGLSAALRIATPLLESTARFLQENADWLKPVAEGVLALTAAYKGFSMAADLGRSGLKLFNTIADEFTSKGKIATAATKGWKAATSDLAGTLGTVVPIVGGIVGGSLMLGQWLGSVGDHARDAAAEVNKFTGAIIDLSQGAPNAGAQLDSLARTAVGLNKSLGGGGALLTDVDTSLANLVAGGHADQAAAAMAGMTKSVQAGGGSIDDLRKLLPKYGDALGEAANNTKQAAGAAKSAQAPFQGLALRLTDTAQAGKNTADDLLHVDTALTNLDKQLAKQQALDDYTKALNDMKDGAAGSSKSIDGNSQSAMDNRKQLEDMVIATRHVYDSQIAAGTSVDDANAKFQAQVDALRTQAEKTYGSKKAVDDFLVSLGLIKPDYTTTLKVDDAEGRATITAFQKTLNGLSLLNIGLMVGKIVGADGGAISVIGTGVKARAEGGPVEPGQTYKVGERGPELVQFAQPGYVIPNDQIRQVGGTTPQQTAPASTARPVINLYFHGQLPTGEQQADMMRQLAAAVQA
jgi:hypothetical protein